MPSTTRFTGNVVFITGAGSGIGRATALAFAREGARVAVADIAGDGLDRTAALVRDTGADVLSLHVDVTDATTIEDAVTKTVDTFGRLDVAFNNAGIEQTQTPTADLSIADFDAIIATDLRSVFIGMKYQIPAIIAAGGGAIVNTSSGAGVIGIAGQAAYAAAKHGLIGLTKSAALEYIDQGVRINAVAPGVIDTAMMGRVTGGTDEGREAMVSQEPIGRMGRPDEIASAVLWLASEEGGFTVGHTLVVDGGQTIG
jgi:NAD(P)-dependent dehydrogenase (short-subunit alcohol dehydrogenase family)